MDPPLKGIFCHKIDRMIGQTIRKEYLADIFFIFSFAKNSLIHLVAGVADLKKSFLEKT